VPWSFDTVGELPGWLTLPAGYADPVEGTNLPWVRPGATKLKF
jgi:hypothetical protein